MIPPLLDKLDRLHIGPRSSRPVQARSDSKNLKDVTNLNSTKTGRVILDIFKPKQAQSDARAYAIPARVSTLKFSNSESDSDDPGEETGWEAITIIYPRRYPRAGPGSNPDDFNVNDLSISADPDASDTKVLTLKSKWLNRLYKLKSAADDPSSCASGQKRPPTDDAKRSKKDKRQRKGGGGDGDGPNGGGGGGGGGGNGRKNNKPPHGHRYPPPTDAVDKFECPFYKYNPVRYQDCRGLCMPRLSDVTQHIDRRHVLKDAVYCPRCRLEFFGAGAEARRDAHLQPRTCPVVNIRDSGVILPREYEEIKNALHSGLSRDEKWNKIYEMCIARPLPLSPYVETETTRRGRAESTLPRVLAAQVDGAAARAAAAAGYQLGPGQYRRWARVVSRERSRGKRGLERHEQ
ncbi:hypothetical protein FDECE_13900 [Fusarium decemcellulare]|nr:hypothetical protein FDECE_13900 [Fusarium decemcellulare]